MEFIKPGTYIDFMKYRGPVITVLGLMATLSLISLFYPGPNYGIDFAGGTEVQLALIREFREAQSLDAVDNDTRHLTKLIEDRQRELRAEFAKRFADFASDESRKLYRQTFKTR